MCIYIYIYVYACYITLSQHTYVKAPDLRQHGAVAAGQRREHRVLCYT